MTNSYADPIHLWDAVKSSGGLTGYVVAIKNTGPERRHFLVYYPGWFGGHKGRSVITDEGTERQNNIMKMLPNSNSYWWHGSSKIERLYDGIGIGTTVTFTENCEESWWFGPHKSDAKSGFIFAIRNPDLIEIRVSGHRSSVGLINRDEFVPNFLLHAMPQENDEDETPPFNEGDLIVTDSDSDEYYDITPGTPYTVVKCEYLEDFNKWCVHFLDNIKDYQIRDASHYRLYVASEELRPPFNEGDLIVTYEDYSVDITPGKPYTVIKCDYVEEEWSVKFLDDAGDFRCRDPELYTLYVGPETPQKENTGGPFETFNVTETRESTFNVSFDQDDDLYAVLYGEDLVAVAAGSFADDLIEADPWNMDNLRKVRVNRP